MSQLKGTAEHNLGLISSRAVNDLTFAHCFVTNEPADKIFISSKTSTNAYIFPLFFHYDDLIGAKRRPNFSPKFLALLATTLGLRQVVQHGIPDGLTPEDIFHYAYGILHSPGYRSRYAEFLKIDFPRLPLTRNMELFRALARLGGELVVLHLMVSPKLDPPLTTYAGHANAEVEKISHDRDTVWLDKSQTRGFRGVPVGVWNFHIGGYQVCEKWLKDRKGRTLSKEDITHYQKIVVALAETIRLMKEIDEVIDANGGWPGAFQSAESADAETAPRAAATALQASS
jgi:predicted helicase